jgi:hypothetical protein
MANFTHAEYKEFGPNILKTAPANRIALVKNPVKADSYATFLTKVIADAAVNAVTDVTFAASGQDLQVTVAGKTGLDPAGTALVGDDLSIAVYNTTTQKVYVCQDATNRAISNETGDTVDIPALVAFVREYSAAP